MLTFRKAGFADIELLGSLSREIWTQCYSKILSPEQIEYMLNMMYSADVIRGELNDGVLWELVEYAGEPIGFISIGSSHQAVKLHKLYLQKKHRGKGFGQQALQHVFDLASQLQCQKVYLHVNKQNTDAIKAYEKAGYVRTDAKQFDIGHGYVMDDYIYSYPLTSCQ